ISEQCAAADMVTVPGAITSSLGYFCFIDKESFPVGILMPKAMAKSEQAFTAPYNLASSPGLLHGHIQFADKETLVRPFYRGANTRLLSASAIAFLEPALGSIKAVSGE